MDKIEREKIYMSDIYSEGNDFPWDLSKSGYGFIKDEHIHYDAEKNMIDIEVIFQRESDGKYFKVEYTQYNYDGDNLEEQTAEEVFPKSKSITVYE